MAPFLASFHKNLVCTSPVPNTCYITRPSHFSWFHHPNNIWWAVQIIQLLNMQSCSLPCYLVPHRSKYLPQYPILEHPHPTFLPQCDDPSLTTIHNKGQNYSCVYLDLCIFGQQTGRQTLGWPWRSWEDNIKMDLQEEGCESMDWSDVAQDMDRWWALVNAVMNLRVR